MAASRPLCTAFVSARQEAGEATDQLELVLEAAVGEARAAWPTIDLDGATFCRELGARARTPIDPAAPLDGLATSDLYLAAACSAGIAPALAECDRLIQAEAAIAAGAAGFHASVRDEAAQIVRTLLFVPRPERPPAILEYAGRGPLRGWLRVMLSRELVRVAKAQNRHVELEEQLVEASEYGDDPVLDQMKTAYRAELAEAFRVVLAELPARDRTLLRHQMVDGLSIDEIGAIHRVHRATAARWLVRLRDELVERTRAVLAAKLGIETAEAASIVRLVQSQLEVSVVRHLGPPPRGPRG